VIGGAVDENAESGDVLSMGSAFEIVRVICAVASLDCESLTAWDSMSSGNGVRRWL
jgi:hypothetical protein